MGRGGGGRKKGWGCRMSGEGGEEEEGRNWRNKYYKV